MWRTEGPHASNGASRDRILALVHEHQGAHLRDLSRRSAIPLGTLLYHLVRLESSGLVVGRRDLGYKRYFAGHSLGTVEKQILGALRRATPLRIAVVLDQVGAATQRDLCARVGASRSTLSFHMTDLIARGVLRCERWGAQNRYMLEHADLTAGLLREFGASLGVATLSPRGSLEAPAPALAAGDA